MRTILLTSLLSGCSDARFLKRNSSQPANSFAAAYTPAPDSRYRVASPDVLDVSFQDYPEWDAFAAIDLDGRLPIDEACQPRVEGMTLSEVRDELAKWARVTPDRVQVMLASPRSGQVFVNGPIRGRMRIVPYQGPEPVIAFLQRIGGLPPGSKLNQVYVLRPHVAAGQRPEVYRVNVEAVLLDGNHATDVKLRPSDQVYIGETKGSSISRSLPHWMGAAYRRIVGLLPDRLLYWSLTPGP